MIQNLIDTLSPICDEIMEQGSMGMDEEYPARFFTFWNTATDDHKHYNNAAQGCVWQVEVNFYSKKPADVCGALEEARQALRAAGWIVNGKGHAVGSDTTTHTGRGFTAVYIER